MTTEQLCRMSGCERKTVYSVMNMLEISGFGIEVSRVGKSNAYRLTKTYGF